MEFFNYLKFPLQVNDVTINPGESKKIKHAEVYDLISEGDIKRKAHMLDSKIEKIETVSVGREHYGKIIFENDKAYDSDLLVGLSYVIPGRLIFVYNAFFWVTYLLILIVCALLIITYSKHYLIL